MPETARAPADAILIKRYAGRRFYDTVGLTYRSLGDLAAMVLARQRFIVRDAATGASLSGTPRPALHCQGRRDRQ